MFFCIWYSDIIGIILIWHVCYIVARNQQKGERQREQPWSREIAVSVNKAASYKHKTFSTLRSKAQNNPTWRYVVSVRVVQPCWTVRQTCSSKASQRKGTSGGRGHLFVATPTGRNLLHVPVTLTTIWLFGFEYIGNATGKQNDFFLFLMDWLFRSTQNSDRFKSASRRILLSGLTKGQCARDYFFSFQMALSWLKVEFAGWINCCKTPQHVV